MVELFIKLLPGNHVQLAIVQQCSAKAQYGLGKLHTWPVVLT